jgi:hypothetical protein
MTITLGEDMEQLARQSERNVSLGENPKSETNPNDRNSKQVLPELKRSAGRGANAHHLSIREGKPFRLFEF